LLSHWLRRAKVLSADADSETKRTLKASRTSLRAKPQQASWLFNGQQSDAANNYWKTEPDGSRCD